MTADVHVAFLWEERVIKSNKDLCTFSLWYFLRCC